MSAPTGDTPDLQPTDKQWVSPSLDGVYWDTHGVLGLGSFPEDPPRLRGTLELRFGGLWVTEPWAFAAGVVGHLGGLVGLGVGGELTAEHMGGAFVGAGLAYGHERQGLGYGRVGYWLLGVEYQQRWGGGDGQARALLAVLRLPVGLARAMRNARNAQLQALVAKHKRDQAAAAQRPSNTGPRNAARLSRTGRRLEGEGRLAEAEAAYERAYILDPRPPHLLDRARVQEARAHVVEAEETLRRYRLERAQEGVRLADQERRSLEARLAELRSRRALLRLIPPQSAGLANLLCRVDGEECQGALQGRDCPVNPGRHRVQIWHRRRLLWEETVQVASGELLRLSPVWPAADAAP